jgi:hypothetical protein
MPILNASGAYDDSKIELWTRAGNPIENTQVWQHSLFDWKQLGDLLERFQNVERVSEACPVYNCHGLTFGSRRTQVTDAIFPILDDDGFDQIHSERETRPGDIVVYLSARGEVVHSGFDVWRKEIAITPGTKTVIPMVWSKWGKGYEMIHRKRNRQSNHWSLRYSFAFCEGSCARGQYAVVLARSAPQGYCCPVCARQHGPFRDSRGSGEWPRQSPADALALVPLYVYLVALSSVDPKDQKTWERIDSLDLSRLEWGDVIRNLMRLDAVPTTTVDVNLSTPVS